MRRFGAVAIVVGLAACESAEPPQTAAWMGDVDEGLGVARARQAKGVMLDLYASWCVPCKQLGKAFETPVMREALAGWVKVRVDVTDVSPEEAAMLVRFTGDPTASLPRVIFLSPDGRELGIIREYRPPDALAAMVPR